MLLSFLFGCREPFSEKDSGKTVYLPIDAPLEIKLEGNPTTGYVWELEPMDAAVVGMTEKPEYKPASDRIGSGGTYTFRFRTVAAGEAEIRMNYRRPFEQDAPPKRSFELKVVVGTMGRIEE